MFDPSSAEAPNVDPAAGPGDKNRARITANVAKMQAQGASDDEIEHYLRDVEGLKPVQNVPPGFAAETTAARPSPNLPAPPSYHDYHAEYASGQLAQRMAAENAAENPSYAQQALGGIASLARSIPFAESAQAGARAVFRGQPYREALNDVHGAEASAPGVVRNYNSIAGGLVAGAALPGSPTMQGARYGVLSGLGQSNPDASVADRVHSAVAQGAVGAAAGKLGDAGTNLFRAKFARSLGANALARKAAMEAADQAAYGKAAQEAAANGGTSPEIQAVLNDPDIKPFVDVIRGKSGHFGVTPPSRTLQGADDATVLQEVYKLMSERQGLLRNRIVNANDFKAGTNLEQADIGAAKRAMLRATQTPSAVTRQVTPPTPDLTYRAPTTAQSPPPDLRTAVSDFWNRIAVAHARNSGTVEQQMARQALERHGAEASVAGIRGTPVDQTIPGIPAQFVTETVPPLMPSFREAVAQHATMAGERNAFRQGANATRRLLNGTNVAAQKLETMSPEAFLQAAQQYTPGEAQAATEGVLGRLRDKTGLSANPFKGFGIPQSMYRASKVTPFLQELEQRFAPSVPGFSALGPQPPGPSAFVGALRALLASQGHSNP